MNAKTIKGILYGIAIAIAFTATAATVYNYFPPPGMTYSPTAGFVVGSATGGAQGAGTVNAQGVFIQGVAAITAGSLPVGANPSASVGLSAVNGSATTFLRSDGAPALSQAIAPTWTATHTFSNTTANIVLNNSGGAADTKNYLFRTSTSGILIQSATDAAPTTPVSSVLVAARSGTAWTAVNFGNATDNPTFSFLGTGAFAVSGGITVGSPTGGNQGTGSINMQSCFVNGVACSTGGAAGANPTASVGLTAVNGSAGTFLRSDGAPALSQAISPTWTGNHTFTPASGIAAVFNGVNNSNAVQIIGGATSGQSLGLKIQAGTTSADNAFNVANKAGTATMGLIRGDGSFTLGFNATTSTMQGSATGTTTFLTPATSSGTVVVQAGGGIATITATPAVPATTTTVGGMLMNAPASGVAVAYMAQSGQIGYAMNSAGTDYGFVQNDSSNKWSLAHGTVLNALGTDVLSWFADGSVTTGAATAQGAGSFNAASQIYQAGNPIYREVSWAGTCTSGGCTTGISKGTGSVTRNSAGNYTVPISSAFGANAGCVASTWSTLNNGAISTNVSTANTSSVNVVVINSSGTAVDSGFTVVCIG